MPATGARSSGRFDVKSRWERFLPTKVRALNPGSVTADTRRRMLLIRCALRLLTSAATMERNRFATIHRISRRNGIRREPFCGSDSTGRPVGRGDPLFDGSALGLEPCSVATSQWPEVEANLSPTTPATIRTMHRRRNTSRDSPRNAIPKMAVPTAPIPVQTA